MESIIWFEKMLSSADSNPPLLCSPTEDIIFEDSFANEIYLKYIDDETSNDFFAEKMESDDEKTVSITDFQYAADKSIIHNFISPMEFIHEDVKANINQQHETTINDQFVMDFNSLLDSVEVSNELTPPQTPPPDVFDLPSPIYQQDNIPCDTFEVYELQQEDNTSTFSFDPESIISSPADIQRELEVVDELVRLQHASDESSISSVWSPRSEYASSSSSCSLFGDDEPKARTSKSCSSRRPRAYRRNPEEKKYRKKEQNKNAATRYRQKKKQEIEIIMDEGKILQDKHRKLLSIYKDSKREVKYLKSLLRDLFKARGFIQ